MALFDYAAPREMEIRLGGDTQPSADLAFPGVGKFSMLEQTLASEWVQKALRHHGHEVKITCKWDGQSRTACAAYQQAQGWSGTDANGVPGPETWRRLMHGFDPVEGTSVS
jgi:Putative peptidoglycan binding domain